MPAGPSTRVINVFMASPSDTTDERAAFKRCLDQLNEDFGHGADVQFVAHGWDTMTSQAVADRLQSAINPLIDSCDLFVLVMNRRWGQPAPDAVPPATSYTEEEYLRALSRFERDGKPSIFAFFKHVDEATERDPGPSFAKVLEFRKQMQTRVLYRIFSDTAAFVVDLKLHLTNFAKRPVSAGNTSTSCAAVKPGPDPFDAVVAGMTDAQRAFLETRATASALQAQIYRDKQQIDELVRENGATKLELAQLRKELEAERAAKRPDRVDRLTDALVPILAAVKAEPKAQGAFSAYLANGELKPIQKFLQVLRTKIDRSTPHGQTEFQSLTKHLTTLGYLRGEFATLAQTQFVHGEIEQSAESYQCILDLAQDDPLGQAIAMYGLGKVAELHGEYSTAENLYVALGDLGRAIQHRGAIAASLSSLGAVASLRGDLVNAEQLFSEALAMCKTIAHATGEAVALRGLAAIAHMRGDLVGAEQLHLKSIQINTRRNQQYGLAASLKSLGNIAYQRGELNLANEYYNKSLTMSKALGYKQSISSSLGSLGIVAVARGQLAHADQLFTDALSIQRAIGYKSGIAHTLTNLGSSAMARGNATQAEAFYTEAKCINSLLGNRRDIATSLLSLATLARTLGDLDKSQELNSEAMDIGKTIDDKDTISSSFGNQGSVALARGKLDEAWRLYGLAFKTSEEAGDKSAVAVSSCNLGLVARARGQWLVAESLLQDALKYFHAAKHFRGINSVTAFLGIVNWDRGQLAAGRSQLVQSQAEFSSGGFERYARQVSQWIADLDAGQPPPSATAAFF